MSEEEQPLATVLVQSHDNELALALGKVIGHAISEVGFKNVNVGHSAMADDDTPEPQTDFEQGKSLLEAMSDANPALFQGRIEVLSYLVEAEIDVLEPEESAHLADILAEDVRGDEDT